MKKILNFLLGLGYVFLVFLWFKDNIYPLKKFPVSYLVPLIGLGIVGIWRLLLHVRERHPRLLSLRPRSSHVIAALLVLLALVFRIPFLVNNFGLMSSDDAVPALMGKHISEGKQPPVYYYGQMYMGSLSEHLQALFFKVLGFSNFMFKFSMLLFFLGFMVIQFYFIRQVFNQAFAVWVGIFYSLPLGRLGAASLDTTGAFPFVLFLGSALMYMAYLICFQDKTRLIPWMGFLMGLAFWTHQISIFFILSALIITAGKLKFCLRKYFWLGLTAVMGCLPVIMLEIFWGFPLVNFLTPGEGAALGADKLIDTARLTTHLLALKADTGQVFFLFFLGVGLVALLTLSIKAKKILPSLVFVLFFLLFYVIFLFSGFSDREAVRYLYPVYFCLPVIFLAGSLLCKTRWRNAILAGLFILLVFIGNGKEILANYDRIHDHHTELSQVTAFMQKTGQRYWQGEYWAAYLLTALSREQLVVDSHSFNRYFPYRLEFHNAGDNRNYVFHRSSVTAAGREGERFRQLLSAFDIGFQYQELGEYTLVYAVEQEVYPKSLAASIPEAIPELELTGMETSRGFLYLEFKNRAVQDTAQAYRLHIEIPDYSAFIRGSDPSQSDIRIRIPHPPSGSFPVKYCLDYEGLVIPATAKEFMYTISEAGPRNRILYLKGYGPLLEIAEADMRLLEKHVKIEINRRLNPGTKVRLHLYSPFEFKDPYWYGDYTQNIRVYEGQEMVLCQNLQDGENLIEFEAAASQAQTGTHIFTLEFKYHQPFPFAPLWKTAALLRRLEIR